MRPKRNTNVGRAVVALLFTMAAACEADDSSFAEGSEQSPRFGELPIPVTADGGGLDPEPIPWDDGGSDTETDYGDESGDEHSDPIPDFVLAYWKETSDKGNDPLVAGCRTAHFNATCSDDPRSTVREYCDENTDFIWEAVKKDCHPTAINNVQRLSCPKACRAVGRTGGECVDTDANFCGGTKSSYCKCDPRIPTPFLWDVDVDPFGPPADE